MYITWDLSKILSYIMPSNYSSYWSFFILPFFWSAVLAPFLTAQISGGWGNYEMGGGEGSPFLGDFFFFYQCQHFLRNVVIFQDFWRFFQNFGCCFWCLCCSQQSNLNCAVLAPNTFSWTQYFPHSSLLRFHAHTDTDTDTHPHIHTPTHTHTYTHTDTHTQTHTDKHTHTHTHKHIFELSLG